MGLRSQDALDQFLEDDVVDALSFARVGEIVLQVRPRRHDLRYVKPWTWGFPDDEVKRLMDRIVWADDEVGARSGELLGRRQHQGRHSRPVSASEVLHVLPEGMNVHRHLGMPVLPHQRLALQADRAEAERSTFGATGSDTNMLRHGSSTLGARQELRPQGLVLAS